MSAVEKVVRKFANAFYDGIILPASFALNGIWLFAIALGMFGGLRLSLSFTDSMWLLDKYFLVELDILLAGDLIPPKLFVVEGLNLSTSSGGISLSLRPYSVPLEFPGMPLKLPFAETLRSSICLS